MKVDYAKMIKAGVMSKPKNKWPLFNSIEGLDRSQYVTASEIGYCERKIKFDKELPSTGDYAYKPDDNWGVFERGHNVEAWLIVNLLAGNNSEYRILHTGRDQVSFADGYQSATPDGVILLDGGVRTFDVKSIDPRTNVSKLPKETHVFQVLQGCDLVAQEYNTVPLGGDIIYVDASDYSLTIKYPEKYIKRIDFDYGRADWLETRAKRIIDAEGPQDLATEGVFKDHCKWCSHGAACTAMIMEAKRERGNPNVEDEKASRALFGQR